MKYIMYRVGNRHYPILFPDLLVHAQVADRLSTLIQFQKAVIVSAGEVSLVALSTTGESHSLDVSAEELDARRINVLDYSGGVDSEMDARTENLIKYAALAALSDV